jgi:hypothetical protein
MPEKEMRIGDFKAIDLLTLAVVAAGDEMRFIVPKAVGCIFRLQG